MNWSHDLKGTSSSSALIAASDAKRDIGYDTVNNALGKLKGDDDRKSRYKLKTCPNDAWRLAEALDAFANSGQSQSVNHNMLSMRIEYWIYVTKLRGAVIGQSSESKTEDFLKAGESLKYKILVKHNHGRFSEMLVTINRDSNGSYWISVLANPTSLILGYNAFAVAVRGKSRLAERRIMMRVPFAVLRRIVKAQNKSFDWHEDTKERIKDLAFRNCPSQVFTYVDPFPKTPYQLLGFLRAIYSTNYSDRRIHQLLCDAIGFEMIPKVTAEGVQTLLFLFRKDGRRTYSFNLYDKSAKAKADAETIKIEIGDESVQSFLSRVVRVDVTIHDQGQREMQLEAQIVESLDTAAITAANYTRAIRIMNQRNGLSGKRFVHWLLDMFFGELLHLWNLLDYKPSKLEAARELLQAYNAEVLAAFNEWASKGFEHFTDTSAKARSVSFEVFLMQHATIKVSRPQARAARKKLLAIGLDPDLPKLAYDAFYNRTFTWDLSPEDHHRLAKSHESGDYERVRAFQKRSRRNTEEVIAEIKTTFNKMVKNAHTPANTLGARET
jgi:hypothetical protein